MPMLEQEEALEIARRVVDASGADETEVVIESEQDRFVRFADTGPTQSADRERHVVSIRARLKSDDGWREAKATCDGVGEEEIRAALEHAVALARVSPPDPELQPLGGPVEVAPRRADPATLTHGFEEKARWVSQAIAACSEARLVPAGIAETTGEAACLVSSTGREVYASGSRATLALTASAPGFVSGAGFGDTIRAKAEAVDAEAVVRRAVGKAVRGRDPRPLAAGPYTVVLEPNAVSSILLFAAYQGFGAQDVAEESSFLCGRLGKQVFPDELSVHDDANNPIYPGCPFDAEGTPKERVKLVDRGVLTGPVTDAHWAHKLGCANTGHALPKPNTEGPKPGNLVVLPGDAGLEELIAGVERGLLITQFHYTNLIDPRDLLLTGMTRNGTFLIEKGELAGGVKNLRFTESLVNAFSNLSGVGREQEVAGALFDGEVVCPALRVEGFRFTSTTDF